MNERTEGYDSSFIFKIHCKCKYQFILKKFTFKGYRFNLSPLYTAMVDNRTIILFPLKPQPKKKSKNQKTFQIHSAVILSYETRTIPQNIPQQKKKKKKRRRKKNNEPFNRIGESTKGIEKRETKNVVDKETWPAKDHGITWHGVSGKRSSRE